MSGQNYHSIDVVIPTHNGSRTLQHVLNGYSNVKYGGVWNIIIIDNASTDNTNEIIEAFKEKLCITHLHHPKPGKNRALNAAIKHLSGDYVILTDDDAIPAPDLLEAYNDCFAKNSQYKVFSGTILPKWEKAPPDWILKSIPGGTAYSLTSDERHKEGPLDYMRVYGPNMAVSREVFDKGMLFNENIGPCGKSYPMGSETDFCRQLEQNGYKAFFCKSPTVQHIIREEQLKLSWIVHRAFKNGRGSALRNWNEDSSARLRLFGAPSYYVTQGLKSLLLLTLSTLSFDKRKVIQKLWDFSGRMGKIYQSGISSRTTSTTSSGKLKDA